MQSGNGGGPAWQNQEEDGMPDLITTALAMAGGVDPVPEVREQNTFTFGGAWAAGETFTVFLTDLAVAAQYSAGYGDTRVPVIHLPDYVPSFVKTFDQKAYVACGLVLAFSGLADPLALADHKVIGGEDADTPGNGNILPGNNFATPEEIKALADYQGKLAIINRNSTQIWLVDVDPANNGKKQVLENIGSFAADSVRSVGMLDVIMLHDSGFRSLQVRDSSGNAVTVDIGTPIDSLVQSWLATLTEAEKAGACAVIEPKTNRYWCHVPGANGAEGVIYVLSYFPSSQIAAWSTYRPTYKLNGVQTAFVPQKFLVKDGQVFARTSTGMHAVSGYDNCGVTGELPWLAARNPLLKKSIQSIDVGCQGSWVVSLASDPKTGVYREVYRRADAEDASSFALGVISIQASTTHFRVKVVENGDGYARFASQAVNYEGGGK